MCQYWDVKQNHRRSEEGDNQEKRNLSKVITTRNWGWPKNPKVDRRMKGLWCFFFEKCAKQTHHIGLGLFRKHNIILRKNTSTWTTQQRHQVLLFLKRPPTFSVSCLFFVCCFLFCVSLRIQKRFRAHIDGEDANYCKQFDAATAATAQYSSE